MELKLNQLAVAQAARWCARLRAPDCSVAERQTFQDWLAQHPAHVQAYRKVREVDERVAHLGRDDARMQALAADALAAPPVPTAGHWLSTKGWRVAAALLLGIGVAALVGYRDTPEAGSAIYANADLGQQKIQLSDGSVVHLDVGSRFKVQMNRSGRQLELLEGRAYFEVAHDAARPFTVRAGGASTVALGTRFAVALGAQDVRVTLVEGSVAITDTANSKGWREILQPGQQLKFNAARGVKERLEVDTSTALGWASGRLIFNGAPLGEAVEEINRYAAVKLRLGDKALAAVPIGGNFAAGGDREQIAEALAAVLPLRIVRVGASDIVLYQRRELAVN